MSQQIIIQSQQPGGKTFVMPEGYQTSVELYCWGAGSGQSTNGTIGAGGGYATAVVTINPGDVVAFCVGGPGRGQTGGSGFKDGRFAGGAGGPFGDEDGDTGGGGGGGGATAVLINNVPVCVAAGAGGAGGGADDGGPDTPGNPGGVYPGHATAYFPISWGSAWCTFLNTYGIWDGGSAYASSFSASTVINFPTTGTYTFYFSTDNSGSFNIDGSGGGSYSTYTSYGTFTQSITAGNHTVNISASNTGGPGGVALQIIKPDTTELWDTRALVTDTGLTNNTIGQSAGLGFSSGGGGGGGYFGGEAGVSYGDDSGPGGAGNGGLSYGTVTLPGSGTTGAGKNTAYYPANLPNMGDAGFAGYIYMVLVKLPGLKVKYSGNWLNVTNSYVRVNPPETGGQTVNTTFNTLGTTYFKIPQQITSLNISYATATGTQTTTIPAIPNSTIPITVGDYGQPSQVGDFTVPAFQADVFSFYGNIDDLDDTNFSVATTNGASYQGSGTSGVLTAGAAAKGIYYAETNERYHGDLSASISINTVPIGVLGSHFQAYISYYSGRYGPTGYAYFLQQPTAANSYVAVFRVYDPGGSEGTYNYTIGLQQQGSFIVSYTYPALITGWKPIADIFIRQGGIWKPVAQSNNIVLDSY